MEEWKKYASEKFDCTPRESDRPTAEFSPQEERKGDVPTDEELEICMKAMKKARAPGKDGLPIEPYKACKEAKRDLFELVRYCWVEEVVPEDMASGTFVTLFKKGCKDDYSKYRMINLLPHAFKMLSCLLLKTAAAYMY